MIKIFGFLSLALAFCLLQASPLSDALRGKSLDTDDIKINFVIPDANVQSRQNCPQEIINAVQKGDARALSSFEQLEKFVGCLCENGDVTCLMSASYRDYPPVVKQLLKAGANPNDMDAKGYTALHFAAIYGNVDIAQKLLEAKAKVDAVNAIGQTPLMVAAFYGNAKTVAFLMSKGANINLKDIQGHTAKQLAQARNKKEVLAVLSGGTKLLESKK